MKIHAKKIMKQVLLFAVAVTLVLTLGATSTFAATKKPKSIKVKPKSITLIVGKKSKICVKSVKPKKASKAVKYKSSNKKVATVSSKGTVTAKKAGKATITVTSKKNKKAKAKVKVTVKAKPKKTTTTTTTTTSSKKAIVIYFSRGENIEDVETYYNEQLATADKSVDAMTSASVLKRDDGSFTGNNGVLADWIAEALGTKTCSIHVKNLYPWTKKDTQTIVLNQEQNKGIYPEVEACTEDLSQYDIVYLGFPNWYGEPPRALYTFMSQNNLDGKTIIPFSSCDKEIYGFSDAINILKSKLPNSVVLDDGLIINRNDVLDSKQTTLDWVAKVKKEAETAKANPLATVAGQKEAASKLVGQTVSEEDVVSKVGEYTKMTTDVNGCTHDVSSVRFFYNGFVIYSRAAKDDSGNKIDNQYVIVSVD